MAYFRKRVMAFPPRFVKRMRRATPTSRVRQFNRRSVRGPRTRGPLRAQVRSLQTIARKMVPEIKYQDTLLASTNITAAGDTILVSGIAQGDTLSTRTGNTINVVSLAIRGAFNYAADAPSSGFCRLLVVVDRQQDADTDPAPGDIIDDAVFDANPVVNLPNLDTLGRFTILHSSPLMCLRRMALDTDNAIAATASPSFEYNWSGNIKVSFNGTAGTDIQKNGIYFIILTDAAGNTLDFSGVSRIGYTDA